MAHITLPRCPSRRRVGAEKLPSSVHPNHPFIPRRGVGDVTDDQPRI